MCWKGLLGKRPSVLVHLSVSLPFGEVRVIPKSKALRSAAGKKMTHLINSSDLEKHSVCDEAGPHLGRQASRGSCTDCRCCLQQAVREGSGDVEVEIRTFPAATQLYLLGVHRRWNSKGITHNVSGELAYNSNSGKEGRRMGHGF